MHHLHLAAVDCLEFFSKRMQWIIVVVLWVILGIAPASWADTIRVDPNSPTDGDGSSWSLAKHSLASVMSSANSGDFILVADATYKPANQASSFLLHSGVSVLGGYAGYGAGNPDARNLDPATNGCVMSGDISGNDGANFTNYSDNCYHVLKTDSNISNSTVIESVTIRGGNASGSNDEDSGGGMFIVSGRPKVRYCRIIENRADNYGGGVWFKNAGTSDDNAIFRDCVISSNYAVHLGGGMYLIPAVHLVNSRLEDNAAGDTGGAVYVGASEDVNIYNCVLAGNTSQGGSAAYCTGGGLTRFANTLMHSNSSSAYGGAISVGSSTEIVIADSTIADNTAVSGGGAVYAGSSSDCTIVNSILWDNESTSGADEVEDGGASIGVTYSDVEGGYTGTGNINSDPVFVGGGDYTLECGSPCINAGDDETLPADVVDVDEINGNEEPLPVDLVFNTRVIGIDSDGDALDMGALETSYVSCYGDLDDDDDVDGDDVLIVIGNWGTCMGDPCVGDLAPGGPCFAVGDGEVGVSDLLTVIANYGRCEESLWNTMNGPSAEQCLDCLEAAAELDLSDEEWIDFMIECLSGE